jgi:outer membrane protein
MKFTRLLYFSFFILNVEFTLVTAQKHSWSLKECIDTGIQRNITLKQGQVSNDINAVNLTQSKDNLYPSLNITDAPGFNFGKTQNTTGAYVGQNTASNTFALTGNVTLYNGLQLQNTIRQNNFIYQAGVQGVRKQKMIYH